MMFTYITHLSVMIANLARLKEVTVIGDVCTAGHVLISSCIINPTVVSPVPVPCNPFALF